MKILTDPDPMLHIECRPDFIVTFDQLQDMFSLMRAHNGVGLAAPQVGIDARLFITEWGQVFINPEIVDKSPWSDGAGMEFAQEGCLSLPGEFWTIGRHKWIKLKTGETFTGFQARVIQHELDHLDGVLINR